MIQGDTQLTPNQGPTYASLSIQDGGMQIRRAAATAREALLQRAADKLKVAKDALTARDGVVTSRSGGDKLAMKIDPAAPLKDPKDYTIVGTSVPRLDIPGKIFGTFNFVQDHKLPGMLHARVVHPAGVRATLQSFDDTACRKIQGYVRAVRKGNLLAVVATNEWAAISASKAIVAKWSDWAGLPVESQLYEYVRSSKVDRNEVLQTAGDTAAGFKQGKRTLQATYDFAMQTHGSIGPSCAVADFKDGRLTVWTPSQASHLLQAQLATMLSLKPENVRCIFVEGAGCYGRNGADDFSSEAAVIAREIGKPVRLQWMRQDEHGWDPKGPPVVLDYRASIDDQGQITAWESDMFMPEQPFKRSGVTLLAAVLAGLPKMPFPGSATPHSGLGIPYALPNNKLTVHWLLDTPLPSAWIRAPGNTQNTFGNETFLDEIAAATGVDPFEIRVRHLKDSRGLEVLERLRALAKWEPRGSRPRDAGAIARGRGVTYSKYESVRTYVAVVADVTVDRTTGQIKVDRVFVAENAGLKKLQAMQTDFVPIAGEGKVQGRNLHRDQGEGLAQSSMVSNDRGQKFCQEKQRQSENKSAAVRELALDPDLSAVKPDQFFRDIETQPQSLAAVVHRIRVLIKALKNQGFGFGTDAASCIGDGDLNEVRIVVFQTSFYHDRTVWVRKFQSIIE